MQEYVRQLPYSCHVCGKQINSWDFRLSGALMYKHLTCEACIAKEYDYTIEELRSDMEEHFGMKPCLGI